MTSTKYKSHNRYSDLVAYGHVSNRMTLDRRINAGLFPPGSEVGENTRDWSGEDLTEYDERVAAGLATTPNPVWLERNIARKERVAARRSAKRANTRQVA